MTLVRFSVVAIYPLLVITASAVHTLGSADGIRIHDSFDSWLWTYGYDLPNCSASLVSHDSDYTISSQNSDGHTLKTLS